MTIMTENSVIDAESVVVLGIFDGVHLGHRKIIQTAFEYSKNGLVPAVFTFPAESIGRKHGKEYEFIYSDSQKTKILELLGQKFIYSPDISSIQQMSGEEFSLDILCRKMNAKAVVCGENFRFGRNASCGPEELKEFGERFGFEVNVCELVNSDGYEISSEIIRGLLKNGEIQLAGKLLGENYFIETTVVTGNRIGRTIDFPTVNQEFKEHQLVPKRGVYASLTTADGKTYPSITNIGVKPTVEKNIKPLAETNIIGYSGDLYNKKIKVSLSEFLRDEQKFNSVEQLKEKISADVQTVKKMYAVK